MSTPAPKIAAALITKDSLGVIGRCLTSIEAHVDEIYVYDTGSSDGTIEHLESLAAEQRDEGLARVAVKRGEWRDDFAWARQRSFEMAAPDVAWLLWLDDDDVLVGGENLSNLAASADPACDGFALLYDYARDEVGNTVMQLWRERLIRRDRGFRWEGRVHELLRRADGKEAELVHVSPDLVHIVHMRPVGRYERTRNIELLTAERLRAEQSETPLSTRTLAYLAAEHMAREEYEQAIPLLEEYLQRPAQWPDERAQVYHRLARCRLRTGDAEAAVATELEALSERDNWGETAVGLTEAYAALDRWDLVERWGKRTLELGLPHSEVPLNPLEFTFLPMIHLAEACFRQGRSDEGQEWLARAWAVREKTPANPA